ncbi:expressed unknown protein [Seminavis robusta]|uniref:Uncharacterized protein n=1 Tax=Seminavis robusta TaxID=568900 RepID=A0A9N8EXQ4_9STRA|nr:expressed unknown protein [Seminavis robusta]|eukprot:Sro2191_g318330.1 n/a (217) ;mRNA; r:2560-3701
MLHQSNLWKAKTEIKCVKDPAGWYLALEFHEGNLITIRVTQSDRRQDAFMQGLIEQIIGNGPPGDDSGIDDLGLIDGFRMRISLENPAPLLNARNSFQRKVIVGVLDSEEEATEENLLSILQAVQRWLQKPENNRFGTRVFIREPGWNLTPPEPLPLRKIDHVLQYNEIVRLIGGLFDNVDSTWYPNNVEAASLFFTEGHIPFEAGGQAAAANNNP